MREAILSPQNNMVKLAASLQQKKYREKHGLFLAEGVRLIEDMADIGYPIELVFYEKDGVNERLDALLTRLEDVCRVIELPEALYKKIALTEESQGIVALARQKKWTVNDITGGAVQLAVLDRVQDPGNIGAIIRTAEAAGMDGVLLTEGCADLYSPKVVRATMGAMLHFPIIGGFTADALVSLLHERDITMYATSVVESKLYDTCDLGSDAAIVFGNEGAGVSDELLAAAKERIHIPIYGRIESLNVAAAAAVICYEAARQKRISCQAK